MMLALPPITSGQPLLDVIHHTDLLTLCGALPSQSVDMILCDLPYGTTACHWDSIIPLEPMWQQFKRVIKPRGAIVLTASQPFTSRLVMSAIDWFRYEWVWDKCLPSGFLNAKLIPLKQHENILVFGWHIPIYFPQMRKRERVRIDKRTLKIYGVDHDSPYGKRVALNGTYKEAYPQTIINFSNADQTNKEHPTQKPVALFEYLIRTYTQPGEIILDPCIGSGTTAIAARQTGRHFIGGDITLDYVDIARARLAKPYTPPLFLEISG